MKTKRNFLIFVICYLAYTAIYIARLNLSMASPEMINAGVLDSVEVGLLGSGFSVVYAFGRFINGNLGDRLAPYVMISTGLLICGISNILIGLFPPFYCIMILWMTNAFAQSMLWSSVLCIISSIYDEKKAKKMTSYMVTSVAVGNILGIIASTFIITNFGVNLAFIIPGGITLLMCTFILLTARNVKPVEFKKNHSSVLSLFSNRDIKITLLPAMLHGVMKDNISVWMTVYFVDKFSINLAQSAFFVLFIPIIGFFGRTIYPLCYKLSGEREHLVSGFGFLVCALASLPLFTGFVNPFTAALCLSLIYAAVSVINTTMLSIFPLQFAKSGNVSSVSGIMDFATYFGAGIGSFIYGFMIKHLGYSSMYFTWIVISVISLFLLKPLYKKN